MSACHILPADAPVVALTLVGRGESLLRLERRLSCAAAGLGGALDLDIRKDTEALGITYDQTPAVLADGQVAFVGLPRTEEIEAWLSARMARRDGQNP
jgi:hypothetical protein